MSLCVECSSWCVVGCCLLLVVLLLCCFSCSVFWCVLPPSVDRCLLLVASACVVRCLLVVGCVLVGVPCALCDVCCLLIGSRCALRINCCVLRLLLVVC